MNFTSLFLLYCKAWDSGCAVSLFRYRRRCQWLLLVCMCTGLGLVKENSPHWCYPASSREETQNELPKPALLMVVKGIGKSSESGIWAFWCSRHTACFVVGGKMRSRHSNHVQPMGGEGLVLKDLEMFITDLLVIEKAAIHQAAGFSVKHSLLKIFWFSP